MMFLYALVSRIRQQLRFRGQQHAVILEYCKIMLPAFAHHHRKNSQCQRTDNELCLNGMAFFPEKNAAHVGNCVESLFNVH